MRTVTLLALLLVTTASTVAAETDDEHPNSIQFGAGVHSSIGPFVQVSYENRPRGIRTGAVPIPLTVFVHPRNAFFVVALKWIIDRRAEHDEATRTKTAGTSTTDPPITGRGAHARFEKGPNVLR